MRVACQHATVARKRATYRNTRERGEFRSSRRKTAGAADVRLTNGEFVDAADGGSLSQPTYVGCYPEGTGDDCLAVGGALARHVHAAIAGDATE